ncbi:MAG: DNA-3-methyladenine glycosylase [Pseudomonadota bacterium]
MNLSRITDLKDVNDGLQKLLLQDSDLEPVAEKADPPPLRLQEPGFAGLARIIIGQQVSRASAEAIHKRFVSHIKPQTPDAFMDAGEPVWIKIGLSRAKQTTLTGVSQAIVSGTLDLDEIAQKQAEIAIDELTALKGIGPWTAEVYLLFCAGHPDIFPAGDLALQEGLRHAFRMSERPNEKETRAIAEKWTPYRGIAARLFWSYYRNIKEGRDAMPL